MTYLLLLGFFYLLGWFIIFAIAIREPLPKDASEDIYWMLCDEDESESIYWMLHDEDESEYE